MFPEEMDSVVEIEKKIDDTVKELHGFYMKRRVFKTMQHDELPHWCRKAIFVIHGHYLKTHSIITPSEIKR